MAPLPISSLHSFHFSSPFPSVICFIYSFSVLSPFLHFLLSYFYPSPPRPPLSSFPLRKASIIFYPFVSLRPSFPSKFSSSSFPSSFSFAPSFHPPLPYFPTSSLTPPSRLSTFLLPPSLYLPTSLLPLSPLLTLPSLPHDLVGQTYTIAFH